MTIWPPAGPNLQAPNGDAPQIHRVDRCANLLCSNRPGEGTFTIFAVPSVALALCAPCAEKMRVVWPR